MTPHRDPQPKVLPLDRALEDFPRWNPLVDVLKDFMDIALEDAEITRLIGETIYDVIVDVPGNLPPDAFDLVRVLIVLFDQVDADARMEHVAIMGERLRVASEGRAPPVRVLFPFMDDLGEDSAS